MCQKHVRLSASLGQIMVIDLFSFLFCVANSMTAFLGMSSPFFLNRRMIVTTHQVVQMTSASDSRYGSSR